MPFTIIKIQSPSQIKLLIDYLCEQVHAILHGRNAEISIQRFESEEEMIEFLRNTPEPHEVPK